MRTVFFGVIALAFLTVGLGLCLGFPAPGREIFGAFSIAVAGIVAVVAGKHGVESLATGGGIHGAASVLMTSAQPPPPASQPPSPAQPVPPAPPSTP
jgi:hypothetical protein